MCHVKVIQKTDDLQDLDEDEYCKYLHDTMSCYHKCYCDGVTCRPKHDEGVAILGKNKECKPLGSGSAARLPASALSGPPSPSLQAPSQVWFSSRPPSPSSPRTSGHGGRPTCPLASCQNPVVCEVQLRDLYLVPSSTVEAGGGGSGVARLNCLLRRSLVAICNEMMHF